MIMRTESERFKGCVRYEWVEKMEIIQGRKYLEKLQVRNVWDME